MSFKDIAGSITGDTCLIHLKDETKQEIETLCALGFILEKRYFPIMDSEQLFLIRVRW